jgi:hypothetical protein
MSDTNIKTWSEIGEQIRRVQAELYYLQTLLSGEVPKSTYYDDFSDADAAVTQLKSSLEDRMAHEHPDAWETDVFYGEQPRAVGNSDQGSTDT